MPERSLTASRSSSIRGSAIPIGSPDATSRVSGWRFRPGDYAVANAEATIAVVERKSLENFTTSLSDGTLAFQMQRLGEVARAAVVVEGRYSALFSLEHVPAAFIADGLARLQVRYPEIPVVFADSRKFAEEWTYRFLAAALSDTESGDPVAERR